MTVTETAKDAVEDLKQQDFFRVIQDPSVSGTERDALRSEKLQQFVNESLNAVGGGDLAGWGAHIQAELRSGGATLPEILSELKKMRRVEENIDAVGLKQVRAAHGYTEEGYKVETAAIDVKPDPVTIETQSAYDVAKAVKAEKSQAADGKS